MSGRQPITPAQPQSADSRPAVDHEIHSVDIASAAAEVVDAATHQPVEADTGAPRGFLGRLYARFGHLLHELGKFGAVGAVAFAVDIVIFNTLLAMDVETLLSGTIAMVVAATVAFVGNRFWTWRDRERSGLRREYSLYFLFNLVGLLIALAVLAISTYGLGAVWPVFQTTLAKNISKSIVGTALGTLFRFWSYRNIVFRSVA